MFNNRTVEKQRAQSPRWISAIVAAFTAAFVMTLFSFTNNFLLLGFTGLFFISYVLARGTMGIRSWIREDSHGKHMLCLRDNVSRANSYVPFEYINKVERCEYIAWAQDNTPIAYRDLPYHRTYTQLAYQGPGLIVSYTSPKHLGGDGQLRSWQIPAPKALAFLDLLTASQRSNKQ